ncbi:hypothetical protein VTI74DRAFT_4128 [Chaetomium olivicolor]
MKWMRESGLRFWVKGGLMRGTRKAKLQRPVFSDYPCSLGVILDGIPVYIFFLSQGKANRLDGYESRMRMALMKKVERAEVLTRKLQKEAGGDLRPLIGDMGNLDNCNQQQRSPSPWKSKDCPHIHCHTFFHAHALATIPETPNSDHTNKPSSSATFSVP